MNRLRVRQLDQMMSILQPELTSPETWEDGPEIWWGQMLAMVENKGARSRHESVRLANGLRENRGLSSMDFSRFRSRGDAGGAGPIWGCTVVIIATDKGIWTSHHWEEPNFILRENIHKWPNTNSDREFRRQVLEFLANGELRRPGSSEKLYRGINDLRRYLIRDRKFLYVRIITPSRVEMGDAWFPERVWRLGEHLAELLGVDTDEITTFTYEKGLHPAGRDMPHGMVTWQYAPATPVEWGDGNWVNSRVLRVRFQDEILLTHVWCAPNTNAPPAPRAIRGRQEILTSGIATSMPAPTNAISIGRPLTCPADTDLPCSPEFCGCDDMDAPEATPPIKRRQVDSDSEDSEDSEDSNDEESDEEVSIFVNGFSTPESFPADLGGADEWWRQMRAAVAQSNSALRSIRWQREDGSLIGRGYTSSDFTWFGEWPGGGGTGPMWGCTAVVIMTNNGIFVSHHWEDPNFMMMAGAGNWPPGTTTEGAFRQYVLNWLLSGEQAAGAQYYGINDLREELINMRNWIDVIIITPHSSRHGGWRLDSNIPYYPQKIDQLRRHLATTLRIERRAIRLLTYPKGRGHWSTPARRWDGILSWQYAPRTPVRPGGRGLFIEARGIRLRWGRDIVTQRVWCIPGTEDQLPTGTRLAARQETTTGNTEIQTRTAEEWMTGTATPTNGIDVDDLVCELPPWTSSTTSTPTTITSVEEEDKPSATAKPTTFPSPTLTVWLTMQPDVGDETPSEAPIFLSDWPFVTTTTTRREAAPKVTSTTSTSTGREAAPKFTTSTASTTTSREAAPKITGTVEYYFDHTLQVWKESNLMFFDLKVYQRGRSIDEIGEGDEKPYNYYGMFSFRDMERPYESSAIQLSNEAPQAMRLLPGEFSVIITPGDGDDEYSIQYNWLEQKWDTDSTRECTHEGAKGDSVSGEYYSERRYCTWHVELWGDDGICTLHPDHKDCKREE